MIVLTFQDLMELPIFSRISLIAGREGLKRQVQRAMVKEIQGSDRNYDNILILSTFSYIKGDLTQLLTELQTLIERNVAGLIIKTRYFSLIPPEAYQLMNKNGVPLFVTENAVTFSEIIYDVTNEMVRQQYLHIEQLNQQHNRLYQALLSNQPLGQFVCNYGRIFSTSCFCLRANGSTAAQFVYTRGARPGRRCEQWAKEIQELKNLGEDASRQSRTCFEKDGCTVFPCKTRNAVAGYFVTEKTGLAEEEFLYTAQVVSFISIKLLEENLLLEKEYSMTSIIVDELLFRTPRNDGVLETRMRSLGYVPSKYYCVVSFQGAHQLQKSPQDIAHSFINLSRQVKACFPGAIVHPLASSLVAILPFADERVAPVCKQLQRILTSDEAYGGLQAGVSFLHDDLKGLSEAYSEAVNTIHFSRCSASREQIHSYYDFPGLRIINSLVGTVEHQNIKQSILDPLHAYDDGGPRNLWKTLEICLTAPSLGEAANRLHIHISTLRYRLKKISELTDADYFSETGRYILRTAYVLDMIDQG